MSGTASRAASDTTTRDAPGAVERGAAAVPAPPVRGRIMGALMVLALVAGVIVLWPATWGGVNGLTVVQGQSMEPTYATGDIVVTHREADYEVGDVVSYVVPQGQPGAGGRVIHRIATADGAGSATRFTTQGDNNATADVWTITARDITGKAIAHVPGVGALFGGRTLPIVLGAAGAVVVMTLLWPSRPRPDETELAS